MNTTGLLLFPKQRAIAPCRWSAGVWDGGRDARYRWDGCNQRVGVMYRARSNNSLPLKSSAHMFLTGFRLRTFEINGVRACSHARALAL